VSDKIQEQSYRIVRGSIRIPRSKMESNAAGANGLLPQGDLLPRGMFDDRDILSWLREGRIERADVTEAQIEESERVRTANPFRVDPVTLVGKTMEDLVIMILEIDPGFDTDTLEAEQDAVRLLTSGWDPKYAQTIAPVNDRSRPVALALNKLEQSQDGSRAMQSSASELSARAQAGLEAARAKAQAPVEDAE
jgi:hypothetical protein